MANGVMKMASIISSNISLREWNVKMAKIFNERNMKYRNNGNNNGAMA